MTKEEILYLTLNQVDGYDLQRLYVFLEQEKSLYISSEDFQREKIAELCTLNKDIEKILLFHGEKLVKLVSEFEENKKQLCKDLLESIKGITDKKQS